MPSLIFWVIFFGIFLGISYYAIYLFIQGKNTQKILKIIRTPKPEEKLILPATDDPLFYEKVQRYIKQYFKKKYHLQCDIESISSQQFLQMINGIYMSLKKDAFFDDLEELVFQCDFGRFGKKEYNRKKILKMVEEVCN